MSNLIKKSIKISIFLKERYEVTKQVVYDNKYAKYWQAYDFNSGYFMSLKLNQVDPEKLRKHLINNYSIGIIALNSTDIRIAFSCVEKEDILMSLNLLLMQLMILNKFRGWDYECSLFTVPVLFLS